MMMLRVAVQKEAQSAGISIKEDAVDQELRKASEGYESLEAFYDARKQQLGMSREDVREDILYKLQLEALAVRGIQVTEADVDQYMSDHPEAFAPKEELKLSHIVVGRQKDAEHLVDLLQQGEDFAELAAANSQDADTASDGGNLGWVEADDPFIAPELLAAAAKLEIGGSRRADPHGRRLRSRARRGPARRGRAGCAGGAGRGEARIRTVGGAAAVRGRAVAAGQVRSQSAGWGASILGARLGARI
ncbi:peptidylprolyl isomerase [Cohnella ginsengisoli]|uniref:Peptidylprolyl isomerase n=1 Tax=Cohnella ginsengisoli TaxID=425004 RepID=A0A9X4QQW4_9BACL|nr:peptidylprolyl isomerase [Cohnella ginsengisoli]MDG0795333.1 peptidylprolyl isomerase [Cohnella ginsengisoli]